MIGTLVNSVAKIKHAIAIEPHPLGEADQLDRSPCSGELSTTLGRTALCCHEGSPHEHPHVRVQGHVANGAHLKEKEFSAGASLWCS